MLCKTLIAALVLLIPVLSAEDIKELRPDIEDSAKRNGVDPALLEAIIRHESANGTSNAARNYNNLGGVMSGKRLKRFTSKQESVESVAGILAAYRNRGLTSIEQISRRYAPGYSRQWISCVSHFKRKIESGAI